MRIAQSLPEAWPHHAYITTDASAADQVLAVFARERCKAERVHNGPPGDGFSVVRGWIENHAAIEIADRTTFANRELRLDPRLGLPAPRASRRACVAPCFSARGAKNKGDHTAAGEFSTWIKPRLGRDLRATSKYVPRLPSAPSVL